MKMNALAVLCCVTLAAQSAYRDAVLIGFRTVGDGQSCYSSGQIGDSGAIGASTDCRGRFRRYYIVEVDGHRYTLTPGRPSGKQILASGFTFGASAAFAKSSVLYGQLPNAHMLVRTDDKGWWVKLGKRESRYAIVEAN